MEGQGSNNNSARVQRLELEVEGYEAPFKFTISLGDWETFQRESARDYPMGASNFILRTNMEPGRDVMRQILQDDSV